MMDLVTEVQFTRNNLKRLYIMARLDTVIRYYVAAHYTASPQTVSL